MDFPIPFLSDDAEVDPRCADVWRELVEAQGARPKHNVFVEGGRAGAGGEPHQSPQRLSAAAWTAVLSTSQGGQYAVRTAVYEPPRARDRDAVWRSAAGRECICQSLGLDSSKLASAFSAVLLSLV